VDRSQSDSMALQQIFHNGFIPRDGLLTRMQYRERSSEWGTIDVDPNTTVSLTRDILAAPIFPNNHQDWRSWIYVVELPLSRVTNVHAEQFTYGSRAFESTSYNRPDYNFLALHAQERAVQRIPRDDIVCAIEVDRQQMQGLPQVQFRPLGFTANPAYTRSPELVEAISTEVMHLMNTNEWLVTPRVEHGYVRNTSHPAGIGPFQHPNPEFGAPHAGPSSAPGFVPRHPAPASNPAHAPYPSHRRRR
jgi:hypothetical protein